MTGHIRIHSLDMDAADLAAAAMRVEAALRLAALTPVPCDHEPFRDKSQTLMRPVAATVRQAPDGSRLHHVHHDVGVQGWDKNVVQWIVTDHPLLADFTINQQHRLDGVGLITLKGREPTDRTALADILGHIQRTLPSHRPGLPIRDHDLAEAIAVQLVMGMIGAPIALLAGDVEIVPPSPMGPGSIEVAQGGWNPWEVDAPQWLAAFDPAIGLSIQMLANAKLGKAIMTIEVMPASPIKARLARNVDPVTLMRAYATIPFADGARLINPEAGLRDVTVVRR